MTSLRSMFVALALAAAAPVFGTSSSFEAAHPDQYFRARAAKAVLDGDASRGMEDFRRAARYADKPSQMALALAYWTGEGVAVDRPTAYAWADLAAERGIPAFVAVRERMWSEMTEAERDRAVEVGRKLATEYQDSVAQRRLEHLLRRGQRAKTGSRTGSNVYSAGVSAIDPARRAAIASDVYSAILGNFGPIGDAGIDPNGNAIAGNVRAEPSSSVVGGNYGLNMVKLLGVAFQAVDRYSASAYYDPSNWDPKLYWRAQDAPWRDLPVGSVWIGPLEKTKGKVM